MIRLESDVMSRLLFQHSPVLATAIKMFPILEQEALRALYTFYRITRAAVDDAHSRREAELSVERLMRMFEFGLASKSVVDQPLLDQAIDETPDFGLAWEAWCALEEEFNVPRIYALEFIRGLQMDAAGYRPQNSEDLLRYVYRTGGVLGLVVCHILRVHASLQQAAIDGGTAMRLTSLADNLVRDFNRGRVYAPVTWNGDDDAFLFRQRADVLYRSAREILTLLPFRERLALGLVFVFHRERQRSPFRKLDRISDEIIRQSAGSLWNFLRPLFEALGERLIAVADRTLEVFENRSFKRPIPARLQPSRDAQGALPPPPIGQTLPVRDISNALRNQNARLSRDLDS